MSDQYMRASLDLNLPPPAVIEGLRNLVDALDARAKTDHRDRLTSFNDTQIKDVREFKYRSLSNRFESSPGPPRPHKRIRLLRLKSGTIHNPQIDAELFEAEYDKEHVPRLVIRDNNGRVMSQSRNSLGHGLEKPRGFHPMPVETDSGKPAKREKNRKGIKYEALSWRWGSLDPPYAIMISQGRKTYKKKITRDLALSLKYLRYPDKDRILWIDAICINQEDDDEKNHQVQMMARIYTRAEQVCVWLGEDDRDSTLAINFIKKEIMTLENFDTICSDSRNKQKWMALLMLMQRPWFSRRWVVQEIALAQKATLYCGLDSINWADFAVAVELFVEAENATHRLSEVMQDDTYPAPSWFEHISALGASLLVRATAKVFRQYRNSTVTGEEPKRQAKNRSKSGTQQGRDGEASTSNQVVPVDTGTDGGNQKPDNEVPPVDPLRRRGLLSLEYLVSTLYAFKATEPRDTVFALLAIARDTAPFADASMVDASEELRIAGILEQFSVEKPYPVEYGRQYEDVCKDFVSFVIDRARKLDATQALDILCRPWAPEPQKAEHFITHKDNKKPDRKQLLPLKARWKTWTKVEDMGHYEEGSEMVEKWNTCLKEQLEGLNASSDPDCQTIVELPNENDEKFDINHYEISIKMPDDKSPRLVMTEHVGRGSKEYDTRCLDDVLFVVRTGKSSAPGDGGYETLRKYCFKDGRFFFWGIKYETSQQYMSRIKQDSWLPTKDLLHHFPPRQDDNTQQPKVQVGPDRDEPETSSSDAESQGEEQGTAGEACSLSQDMAAFPLPSWVARNSAAPFDLSLHPGMKFDKMSRTNADPLVGAPHDGHRNYSAAQTESVDMQVLRFRKRSSMNRPHYSLYLKGFELDVVEEVAEASQNGAIPVSWIKLARWEEAGKKDPPDHFWRTLVADRGKNNSNPPHYYARACKESVRKGGIKSHAVNTTALIREERNSIITEFCRRVQEVIWNRRLIRTKQGLLGLASSEVLKGDRVCILYGCTVPVILRQQTKTPEETEEEQQEDAREALRRVVRRCHGRRDMKARYEKTKQRQKEDELERERLENDSKTFDTRTWDAWVKWEDDVLKRSKMLHEIPSQTADINKQLEGDKAERRSIEQKAKSRAKQKMERWKKEKAREERRKERRELTREAWLNGGKDLATPAESDQEKEESVGGEDEEDHGHLGMEQVNGNWIPERIKALDPNNKDSKDAFLWHTFLGESYIHGMMDGKALRDKFYSQDEYSDCVFELR
ncbi:hypothetical protein MKZ38_005713 [Zalerion maritima]|uniref:Heterokaryon incompatibility domain-containing protein n=1 Tax=Zalerion maritima TaxID=339359 RepID=A0AAD5WNU5_9PEZI|nr:hypothetical protein MKZ38_005713 [Zalerion maritima]